MYRLCLSPALFCCSLLVAGCGDHGPPKGTVTGSVTLDGQPLAAGTIMFSAADNSVSNVGTKITGGSYTAEVYAGKMQVRISSLKVVGKRKLYDTPDSPTDDITEEQVPARYNVNTELSVEIKPGQQKHDFALTSR